jgi:hypothetical protein
MDNQTFSTMNNYELISKICLNQVYLKGLFKEKKDIDVTQPEEIKSWLDIMSAINLQLAEKVGKIEVLLRWYKIITGKQDYSKDQIEDTEKQIREILEELINVDLDKIDLDENQDELSSFDSNFDFSEPSDDGFDEDLTPDNQENITETIDLDFHLNLDINNQDESSEINENEREITAKITTENKQNNSIDFDFDFLPIQEDVTPEINENETIKSDLDILNITSQEETQREEINLDFIPLKSQEEESKPPEINYETASRADLIPQDDQENVELFAENTPIEAADEDHHIYGEGEPITMEELQFIFNKISKLSMRYLGGALTQNYFHSTQPDDPWAKKFQINNRGQISISENLSQQVSPQELITFKQWTSKFIKNCSTIINNFSIMVKKQNLLGRL